MSEVLFVTGGATGIGAAVATLGAEQGCTVAICDVNEERWPGSGRAVGRTFYTV